MKLSFLDWERDGILVLSLIGRITLGDGTRTLRELIQDAIAMGKTQIVLNLAEVIHIDSSGLGELVSAHAWVRRSGGCLKLARLTDRTQDLINLTKLHSIFEVFADEDSAVRSFAVRD